MKKSIAIILICLLSQLVWGQGKTPFRLEKGLAKDAIFPGTIVVKLKSKSGSTSSSPTAKSSKPESLIISPDVISKETKILGAKEIKKVFKESSSTLSRNRSVKVDLSNIYFIKIDPNSDIESSINLLLQNDNVEYAEPYYNHKILLVPNDPKANPSTGNQYQLTRVKAYEAWDIQRGDSSMIIGLVDTGFLLSHQDLSQNVKINYYDPINNIDDDNDGYIDNFNGWDFSEMDNNPTNENSSHGTEVAGCSNGRVNNGVGIAGTSFNCKYLPLKVFKSDGKFSGGFEAIKYAADNGCKVINLSWGNEGGYSRYEQDIINYAVLQKDVVIVAAAGNTGTDAKYYPASYDNVLSVGATNSLDQKASFSTFNNWIDICAPGDNVGTTNSANTTSYGVTSGTSFASPIVAGAAALVRLKFPKYNALQVMEQLRVTADNIFTKAENAVYSEKLGKGRLNMLKALTDTASPAVRIYSATYNNGIGNYAFYEDTVKLSCIFKNYLSPTTNLKVTLSSMSPYVTIIDGQFVLGKMGKLDSKDNNASPFKFYLSPSTPDSQKIVLRLGFEDGAYVDYQYIEFYTSPDYLDTKFNSIALTTTSRGRIGFKNDAKTLGIGVQCNERQLLGSAGVIFATSDTKVSNNVISDLASGYTDQNLTATKEVKYVKGSYADVETKGTFVDTISNDSKVGIVVTQRAYGWKDTPEDNYVILEYSVTNKSGNTLPSLYSGLFADWNIDDITSNKAGWDAENNLGYIYSSKEGNKMVGVGILSSGSPAYFALDKNGDNGTDINLANGFSRAEKWKALSNGIARTQSGESGAGSDVAHVIGVKVDNIENKKTIIVAFALVVGNSIEELREAVNKAKVSFNNYQANPSTSLKISFCTGSPATVTRPENKSFKLYGSLPLTTPFYSGTSYTTEPLNANKIYYITNEDEGFESEPTRVVIEKNDAIANFDMDQDTVDLVKNNKVNFYDLTNDAVKWNWDFDNGYKSTNKNPIKIFTKQGIYNISLSVENSTGCKAFISKKLVVISSSPLPVVPLVSVCKGENATIAPSNGTVFNFYESFPLTTPVHTGSTYSLSNLQLSKKLWITNLDSLVEGEALEYTLTVWNGFANFNFSSDTLVLDKSNTITVKDAANNSIAWKWVNGEEVKENAGTASFSFHKTGVYPIKFVVVNSTGCLDSITKNLVVVRKSPTPESKNYTICKNTALEISYASGSKFRFYESYPGIPLSEGSTFSTGPVASNKTIYVTNIDSVVESAPVQVIIKVETLGAEFTASADTLRLDTANIIHFQSTSDGVKKMSWDFGNGKSDTIASPSVAFDQEGIFNVKLITENTFGCRDSTSKSIVVLRPLSDKSLNEMVSIYPNPAHEVINIHSTIAGIEQIQFELINSKGQLVKTFPRQKIGRGDYRIESEGLDSGLYFLRISSEKETILKKVLLSQ